MMSPLPPMSQRNPTGELTLRLVHEHDAALAAYTAQVAADPYLAAYASLSPEAAGALLLDEEPCFAEDRQTAFGPPGMHPHYGSQWYGDIHGKLAFMIGIRDPQEYYDRQTAMEPFLRGAWDLLYLYHQAGYSIAAIARVLIRCNVWEQVPDALTTQLGPLRS